MTRHVLTVWSDGVDTACVFSKLEDSLTLEHYLRLWGSRRRILSLPRFKVHLGEEEWKC